MCGSGEYFSQGLCQSCHPGGPHYRGSCRDCLAWGVYRQHSWLCWACRWWKTHYPLGQCLYCRRQTRIGELHACRLCVQQAWLLREPGRALDLPGANRYGQQLFFANMVFQRRKTPRLKTDRSVFLNAAAFTPTGWTAQTLFDAEPDPKLVKQRSLNAESDLLGYCTTIVAEHAARHGWSNHQRTYVIRSLRMLDILQDTPGAKIRASEVLRLRRYDGNINSTLDVLDAAGLLIDDRPTRAERYFAGKTADLPEPMKTQLEVWLEVMLNGSTTSPRRRSRHPLTARIHIMGIAPILQSWAEAGHQSLAEITPEQVRTALPETGAQRNWAEFGLRSLFKTLKARKLIFTDPTRGLPVTPVNATVPLPLDTDAIRAALDSPDPAVAAAVALVAFHAITSKQLAELKLTDVIDGRLTLHGRVIPLAGPVRVRLAAWLDHRATTWPGSINPHLFINRRSAPRLTPSGRQFPWRNTTIKPQALREDRILQEIHATGGDVRRICDLFGINVETALRYARTLDATDRTDQPGLGSRTPGPT
jgi:hypothetical protein